MNNIAILGSMWGDEGKGAVTHHLSKDYDWVIRFSGGANAGHTLYRNGKKYVHNLLPSVDFRFSDTKAYLGSGMVIDLEKLYDEVVESEKDFPGVANRIYVDKNAFIVENKHKEEDKANNAHIGSTNRGIGPAYADKIGRKGIRVSDVMKSYFDLSLEDNTKIISKLTNIGVHFVNLLDVKSDMMKSKLLYEGAQGILLDINQGIYPYVSCGESTVAGIYSSGFHFAPPEKVYGVAKCYTTKVGEGPFPTELQGKDADLLRKIGNEYGATTGRPRRVGWLDLPALKYACDVGGISDLILTKFDILNGLKIIPICNGYNEGNPVNSADFFKASPQYIDVKGWDNAKNESELLEFIHIVERYVERKVRYISAGTKPEDFISW